MLQSLDYALTFPTTGKRLQGHIDYADGLTAITGPNEAGKTTAGVELPRYALFGAKALRGQKSDYSELTVKLGFTVQDESYVVERSLKAEVLKNAAGDVLAVGADAINKKIPDLLGFPLEMFDITNASTQGNVQRLTDMTPAERKQMIDRLIGLDVVEAIEKQCRDEVKTLQKSIEAMKGTLTPPTPPSTPQPAWTVAEVTEAFREAQSLQRRIDQLTSTAASAGAEPPQPTGSRPSDETLEALVEKEREHIRWSTQMRDLEEELQATPPSGRTPEDVAAAKLWLQYQDELVRRGVQPTLTLEEIEAQELQWAACQLWRPSDPCSKCGHRETGATPPEEPNHSLRALAAERKALDLWSEPLIAPSQSFEGVTAADVLNWEKGLGFTELVARCAAHQAEEPDDPRQLLGELRSLQQSWQVFDQLHATWTARKTQASEAQQELDTLTPPDFDALEEKRTKVTLWNQEQARFEVEQAQYTKTLAAVVAAETRAEEMASGGAVLKDVRAEFKNNLAPAIGTVASQLLAAMTNGARGQIVVNPDFDITVDGQPVRTLSGSAKGVANLAMRVALGQVLTNRMFPVFLGDEIDSDMDDERAGSTVEAMRAVSTVLKQVILVSHKDIDADHYIRL